MLFLVLVVFPYRYLKFLAFFELWNIEASKEVVKFLLRLVSTLVVIPSLFVRTFQILSVGVINRHELYLRYTQPV